MKLMRILQLCWITGQVSLFVFYDWYVCGVLFIALSLQAHDSQNVCCHVGDDVWFFEWEFPPLQRRQSFCSFKTIESL